MRTKLVTLSLALSIFLGLRAQNWQYVGAANINQANTGSSPFGDLEITTSGDLFLGYAEGLKTAKLAKYSGGSWQQVASVSSSSNIVGVDIETSGNDCYLTYETPRSNNYYLFVYKLNGSSLVQVGDSLLLGSTGSGSFFDFVVDGNGTPTILGPNGTGGKVIKQYTGGAWTNLITLAGSLGTVFIENSAAFDSQNKLYCVTSGFVISPSLRYYLLLNKIDGTTRSIVGDTINIGSSATSFNKLRFDASGTPHLCFNYMSRVIGLKLNTNTWTLIGDTTKNLGIMYSAEVMPDGKLVFYTIAAGSIGMRVHYYANGNHTMMDTLNTTGITGAVPDLLAPKTGNEIYACVHEIGGSGSSDLSVMKHVVTGGSTAVEPELKTENMFTVYPNPASDYITLKTYGIENNGSLQLYDFNGRLLKQWTVEAQSTHRFDVHDLSAGLYFLKSGARTQKLLLE